VCLPAEQLPQHEPTKSVMNWDQIKGNWKQFLASIKGTWGKRTGTGLRSDNNGVASLADLQSPSPLVDDKLSIKKEERLPAGKKDDSQVAPAAAGLSPGMATTQPTEEIAGPPADEQRLPRREDLETRAYYKWLTAGKPKGQDMRFWLEAEQELGQSKR
jgi:hypothetical protein